MHRALLILFLLLGCGIQHRSDAAPPCRLLHCAPATAQAPDAGPAIAPAVEPFDLIAETDRPLVGGETVRLRFGGYARVKLARLIVGVDFPEEFRVRVLDQIASLDAGQTLDREIAIPIPPDDYQRCITIRANGDGTIKVAHLRVNSAGRPRAAARAKGLSEVGIDLVASEPLRAAGVVDLTLHMTKVSPQSFGRLWFTLPEGAEQLGGPLERMECTWATADCSLVIHVRLPPRPGFVVKGHVYTSFDGTFVLELSDRSACGP